MARIGAALGLTVAVIVHVLTRTDIDPLALGLLLTTIGLLLGVEAIQAIRGQ